MSISNPSVRVSTATRRQHWRIDKEEKRTPIPWLIWNDGHGEWSRPWYSFKDNHEHVLHGHYVGFK